MKTHKIAMSLLLSLTMASFTAQAKFGVAKAKSSSSKSSKAKPRGHSQSCQTQECRDKGTIEIWGEVPICLDLEVVDISSEADFDQLGKEEISRQKVGEI